MYHHLIVEVVTYIVLLVYHVMLKCVIILVRRVVGHIVIQLVIVASSILIPLVLYSLKSYSLHVSCVRVLVL